MKVKFLSATLLLFWVVVGFGQSDCGKYQCYAQGGIPVGDDLKEEDYPGGSYRDNEGDSYVDYDFYRKHGEVPSPGIGHRK